MSPVVLSFDISATRGFSSQKSKSFVHLARIDAFAISALLANSDHGRTQQAIIQGIAFLQYVADFTRLG